MTTTVVHWNDRPADGNYVYIGRPSLFGNPFVVERHGRKRAIELFRVYFHNRLNNLRDLDFAFRVGQLKGRVLVCHCKPMACHGDVIAEFLDALDRE